jgi:urea carboxylase
VVEVGAVVEAGDQLVILESMKMEIAITASVAGTVINVLCAEGQLVAVGQNLVVIQS